jgi:hypothetical protein
MDNIVALALENLERTSRTSHGVSDTSSSADKPKLQAEGAQLASAAERNFVSALRWAFSQEIACPAEDSLRTLVEGVAERVSMGLLQLGQSLFRTWETKYPMQTRVAAIEADMAEFYQELASRLQAADPVATAAWVEWKLDARIHPFADGCGRTTKVVAYWVLVREGFDLPRYENRDAYYAAVIQSLGAWTAYYRTLFS